MYDRIQAGEFDTKVEYPDYPQKPAILSKKVSQLSKEEIAQVANIKAEYDEAMKAYREGEQAWRKDRGRLEEVFGEACIEEMGWDADLEISHALYHLAWQQGHSAGYVEVWGIVQDLDTIYKAAMKVPLTKKKGK